MVTTRSMSGTTKTVKPPKVVERNSTRRKSGTAKTKTKTVKPPKVIERFNSIRDEAMSIFMIKDYLRPYYKANPTRSVPDEVIRSGHVEWFYMSESEKAPWIKLAEKMKAEGISLYFMRCNTVY